MFNRNLIAFGIFAWTQHITQRYRPAAAIRLHVTVNHHRLSEFSLREDLHHFRSQDAVQQLLRTVGGEGEPQRSWGGRGERIITRWTLYPLKTRTLFKLSEVPVVNVVNESAISCVPLRVRRVTLYMEPGWSLINLNCVSLGPTRTSCHKYIYKPSTEQAETNVSR